MKILFDLSCKWIGVDVENDDVGRVLYADERRKFFDENGGVGEGFYTQTNVKI